MSSIHPQFNNSEYAVGWIAALPHERAAAESMLDEKHAPPQSKNPQDPNIYTLGSIDGPNGKHNVVIASLPVGRYGTTAAATAAAGMLASFPQIKFGLMVGIGSGIPSDDNDIRLGDVVVSKPEGSFGGVRQYDCGKATAQGFEERGDLNSPPSVLLNAVSALQSKHERAGSDIPGLLDAICSKYPLMSNPRQGAGYVYQGSEHDRLFDPDYEHPNGKRNCHECDASRQLERPERANLDPYIFYGTIASGNRVVKNARRRDIFPQCLCFETEAAGLMNDFPCLVIRGICDYCDSHKNVQWQRYAAATAAAYAKELMQITDVEDVQNASEARTLTSEMREIKVTPQKNEQRVPELEDRRCRKIIGAPDPVADKKRIEEAEGGLLEGSYHWVLNHDEFKRWRNSDYDQILWIKGNPGKGKTMLICGIIDELSKEAINGSNIAYFFCQANSNRINNATAVLWGLISMLVQQQSSLISHIPDDLSENKNAWVQVCDVLLDILGDEALGITYLIIDALDECIADVDELLRFLEKHSSSYPHVKWVVSSRDWQNIRETLEIITPVKIDLELHEHSLSDAVQFFIEHKVKELSDREGYTEEQKRNVQNHLELNAKGTFLWVALICKQLYEASKRYPERDLRALPVDLDDMYHRMLSNIHDSKYRDDAQLCISLLGIVTTVYRPITLDEIPLFLDLHGNTTGNKFDDDELIEIVGLCGPFLTLQQRTITLVHQSAQDFLQERVYQKIHPDGEQKTHYSIFSGSLKAIHSTLKRNIYKLNDPAISINEVKRPDPDPLATIGYACIYWVDHLQEYSQRKSPTPTKNEQLQDLNPLRSFMCNDLLHWIEALGLLRSLSAGATSMLKLESLLKKITRDADLIARVQDAYRFIIHNKMMIDNHPLQVYSSAVFFTPRGTITRNQFETNELGWLSTNEVVEEGWGQCLQTLVGNGIHMNSVVFSSSGTLLASGHAGGAIKIWDPRSGQCLRTFKGQGDSVYSLVFSHDDAWLVSGGSAFEIWQTHSWQCLQTFDRCHDPVRSVALSPSGKLLASGNEKGTIHIWDTDRWQCLQTLETHRYPVNSVAFSPDGTLLASGKDLDLSPEPCRLPGIIHIWDTSTWQCLQTLESHRYPVTAVAFSPNGKLFVSGRGGGFNGGSGNVQIWDVENWHSLQQFDDLARVTSVAFSNDGSKLASGFQEGDIRVWDTHSWQCLQTFKDNQNWTTSVAFSNDGAQLAAGSMDSNIRLWDMQSNLSLQSIDCHHDRIGSVEFSPDGALFASTSTDGTIKIWDAYSGQCLQTIEDQCVGYVPVAFSPDGLLFISGDEKGTIKVWEPHSWRCLKTLENNSGFVCSIAFSPDGMLLVCGYDTGVIKVWDPRTWKCLRILEAGGNYVRTINSVVFSPDNTLLACLTYFLSSGIENVINIWDLRNGDRLKTIWCQDEPIISLIFSPDGALRGSDCSKLPSKTMKVWDILNWHRLRTREADGSDVMKLDVTKPYVQINRGSSILPSPGDPTCSLTDPESRSAQGFG
ncbi:hypothetical protein N7457_003202, partial [Penicillium paradoxum]|uniref:uncharacterized protein n=1 Tax=Penicillium paradoxum TaxID=176176 RepID=UPI002546DB07